MDSKIFKIVIFFILLPVYIPAYVLMHFTFKWWSSLLD